MRESLTADFPALILGARLFEYAIDQFFVVFVFLCVAKGL